MYFGNLESDEAVKVGTALLVRGAVQISGRPVAESFDQVEHLPVALRPSPAPCLSSDDDFLSYCKSCASFTARYLSKVARDYDFLERVVRPAAEDEKNRGDPPRLWEMLRVLEEAKTQTNNRRRRKNHYCFFRTDFLVDGLTKQVKQVETNTISAAFSCSAGAVWEAHHGDRAATTSSGGSSSCGLAELCVRAATTRRKKNDSENENGTPPILLVVCLVEEHLVCENKLEAEVRRQGVRVETRTLDGCARDFEDIGEGLSLNNVDAIYFRGGISPECWGMAEYSAGTTEMWDRRWAVRRRMERSGVPLLPDVGWWLAGTKVVQSRLWRKETLERYFPSPDQGSLKKEVACLSKIWGVGEEEEEEGEERASFTSAVLKREPLGIWSGEDSITARLEELAPDGPARDHLWMERINPCATENEVEFVRKGKIYHKSTGVQETGVYVACQCEEEEEEVVQVSETVLVRTKPVHEVDGGVCKGIAVLDSFCE